MSGISSSSSGPYPSPQPRGYGRRIYAGSQNYPYNNYNPKQPYIYTPYGRTGINDLPRGGMPVANHNDRAYINQTIARWKADFTEFLSGRSEPNDVEACDDGSTVPNDCNEPNSADECTAEEDCNE
jgi:hypothetical protein